MGVTRQPRQPRFEHFLMIVKDETVLSSQLKEAFFAALVDSARSRAGDAKRIMITVDVER